MTAILDSTKIATLADLQHHLGDIPASRIRLRPAPGTATEEDVVAIHARENRLCELVDGVLVEKGVGFRESVLAMYLLCKLQAVVCPPNLGLIAGEGGMLKLSSGLVRIPDVSFSSWDRIPGGTVPNEPIPKLTPNLAVEVLSDSNTPAEMKRKRKDYFKAGVSLVWIIDPKDRTVTVYTSPKNAKTLTESDTLDGGDVLPGFTLSLRELFAKLDWKAPE